MTVRDDRIVGRHAILTGGSSGIGLALARQLIEREARISIVARGEQRLARAAEELRAMGGLVATAAVDVRDAEALQAAFSSLCEQQGPCDILVTSAGVSRPGRFEALEAESFRTQMDVNYFGTLNALRSVVPGMIERRRGSVVGISSAAAFIGVYGYTAYAASKFAVRGLLEALRTELAPHGVHVACVYPPDVRTPMLEEEDRFKPPETRSLAGTLPPLEPESVAASIVRGIERHRFAIVPDWPTWLLARLVGPASELIFWEIDRRIARLRRESERS